MNPISSKELARRRRILLDKEARKKSLPRWSEKVANRILALLAKRPMKPSEVCKEMGMTKSTINKALSGHRHKIYTVGGGKAKQECVWELRQ